MSNAQSVFNIIGPVMIGPSSSHTAGAARLGKIARAFLGSTPRSALMELHGSFWHTHEGHGTDLAIVAGLLGFDTDDERIKRSFSIAAEQGLHFSFEPADLGDVHPNSVRFHLRSDADSIELTGASVGGGNILVTEVMGFETKLTGRSNALFTIHEDRPGVIASVAQVVARHRINIAFMRVSRQDEGTLACMILESDSALPPQAVQEIAALPPIRAARVIEKV